MSGSPLHRVLPGGIPALRVATNRCGASAVRGRSALGVSCIMARSNGSANTRKGKSTASSAAAPADASGTTLIKSEQHAVQEKFRRSSSFKVPKDTERKAELAVNKAIRDNFRHFSPSELDGFRVDGKTLRETLRADKVASMIGTEPALTMGKIYYRNLREKFQRAESGSAALVVENDSEEPSAAWVEALTRSRSALPARERLNDLLQSAGPPKQCEYVALLLHALELKATDVNGQLGVLLNIIRFIQRNGLAVTFPRETQAFRVSADRALCAVYLNMKAKGLGPEVFWSVYKGVTEWLLPTVAIDRLLEVKGSWDGCDEDIDAVTSASELGMRMFSGAVKANIFGRVKALCLKLIEHHLGGKDITEQRVSDVRAALHKGLLSLQVPEVPHRIITVNWCSHDIKVQVDSAWEECRIRLHSYIKQRALTAKVDSGAEPLLTPLFVERELLEVEEAKQHSLKIEPVVLKTYKTARNSALNMLPADKHSDGAAIMDILQSSEDVLSLIDDSICLEIAWFRLMLASGGAQILERKVMSALPAEAAHHDAKDFGAGLARLKLDACYRFCQPAARSVLDIACEWVSAIANQRAPSLAAATDSPALTQIQTKLAFFCSHTSKEQPGREPRCLFGVDALAAKFTEVQERIDASEPITIEQLRCFHVFSWLLTNDQRKKHSKWCNDIYKKAGGKGDAPATIAAGQAGRKASAASSSSSARANAQMVEESTMALFKKRRTT